MSEKQQKCSKSLHVIQYPNCSLRDIFEPKTPPSPRLLPNPYAMKSGDVVGPRYPQYVINLRDERIAKLEKALKRIADICNAALPD